jgi:hypothetical protein
VLVKEADLEKTPPYRSNWEERPSVVEVKGNEQSNTQTRNAPRRQPVRRASRKGNYGQYDGKAITSSTRGVSCHYPHL